MNRIPLTILLLLFLSLLCSCGDSPPQYENYGDVGNNTGGSYILTSNNHPHGHGQRNCFLCHNINKIHREDRVASDYVPTQQIIDQVNVEGLQCCKNCHGPNGVQ